MFKRFSISGIRCFSHGAPTGIASSWLWSWRAGGIPRDVQPSTPRAGVTGMPSGRPARVGSPTRAPAPGAWLPRRPAERQRHANPRGTKRAESLRSAPLLSNCAWGAASTGDLLARSSLLPDLRPRADSRGASMRPCPGALPPRLPPPPPRLSRKREGTEARGSPLRSPGGGDA